MKFAAVALLALPFLAVATPTPNNPPPPTTSSAPASSCDTGSVQCCDSTVDSNSAQANALLGLLGIVLGDITGLIGLSCSPISVIGVGTGSACSSNAVCCSNTQVGGLIGIGCVPITL
ncbi:fungal hydrophobin [Phanerochaete sordida]|uniref:Hydrophobin n=1 Tax=Phanerochaete sordida TaxID=48140 RepID=A0A9P3LMW1_9APHY|nr:fungal hydrophobin [Phanerochaete sordida]